MLLRFITATSADPAISHIAGTLKAHLLAGERVLWLVSGGSAIQIAVGVARQLQGHPLQGLVATLVDERFGPPGHAASNWRALAAAGFALPGATLLPVLTGADLAAATATFARTLQARLATADYRLGLFGIGPDGHIAGILPHSPAVTATALAAGYDARTLPSPAPGDPTFVRITMTPAAIVHLDEAVVYAVGKAKGPALDKLAHTNTPLADQPAQVLKSIPTTIYRITGE